MIYFPLIQNAPIFIASLTERKNVFVFYILAEYFATKLALPSNNGSSGLLQSSIPLTTPSSQ